jgi:hypothetical protein
MTYGSRAELADAIHGRYRAATAKKLAKLPSCQTHPDGPEDVSQSHAERFDLELKQFARLDEPL